MVRQEPHRAVEVHSAQSDVAMHGSHILTRVHSAHDGAYGLLFWLLRRGRRSGPDMPNTARCRAPADRIRAYLRVWAIKGEVVTSRVGSRDDIPNHPPRGALRDSKTIAHAPSQPGAVDGRSEAPQGGLTS